MTTGRPTLREDQIAVTRERLLEAAAEMLADDEELGFRALAARAGVSAPTVYRHFPTPDDLLPALLVHLERRLGVTAHPRTFDEYLALLPSLFGAFQENERFMRAYLRAPRAVVVRERNWGRRAGALAAGLPPHPVFADPAAAERFTGLLLALGSASTWHAMVTVTDLRGPQVGHLVAWAMRALERSIADDPAAFLSATTLEEPS